MWIGRAIGMTFIKDQWFESVLNIKIQQALIIVISHPKKLADKLIQAILVEFI